MAIKHATIPTPPDKVGQTEWSEAHELDADPIVASGDVTLTADGFIDLVGDNAVDTYGEVYADGDPAQVYLAAFDTGGESAEVTLTGATGLIDLDASGNIQASAVGFINLASDDNVTLGTTNASVTVEDAGVNVESPADIELDADTGIKLVGRVHRSYTTVTGTLNLGSSLSTQFDIILADATSGNVVINLPDVTTGLTEEFTVKRIDASGNTVTINRGGSDTFEGGGTSITLAAGDIRKYYCIGNVWYRFI